MKVLVSYNEKPTHILGKRLREEILSRLKEQEYPIQTFGANIEESKNCLGCFGCWVKTPGTCVIKDKQTEFSKAYISNDTVILITQIKYGTYEPVIKNMLDRNIPNVLPFFETVKGETHHQPRYKNYPEFIVVGYGEDLSQEEVETFKGIINANSINMKKSKGYTFICESEEKVEEIVSALIELCKGLEV